MFGTCFRNGARTLCHADDAACRGGDFQAHFFGDGGRDTCAVPEIPYCSCHSSVQKCPGKASVSVHGHPDVGGRHPAVQLQLLASCWVAEKPVVARIARTTSWK